jgi:peroxiredoxin Q/BCP
MVNIGQQAPDFELPNQNGETIRLGDYRGKNVVIFAFPKANTAGCTQQACAFRDDLPQIETSNAVVLGISVDSQEELKAWHDKHNLQYDLLSDPDMKVIGALGAGDNSLFGLIKFPGAKRSYWVIDETGKIMAMQVGVSPRASAEKALAALKTAEKA